MSSRQTVLAVAGAAALGLVAYAVYFDYKRRNDVSFRKKLRKEKKRIDKTKEQEAREASTFGPDDMLEALEQIKSEKVPEDTAEKETYFMTQVGIGEQLASQGPAFHLLSALHFYKGLRVYPTPVDLMLLYEKTIPAPIFKLIMELTNLDVRSKVEGYYKHFPPKNFGVTVESPETTAGQPPRKVLVCSKDFAAGDVIYTEYPVVSALDNDIQKAGTHCTHCFRSLKSDAIKINDDPISAKYCSESCQTASRYQSQNLLFTQEPALPASVPTEPIPPQMREVRRKAQGLYAELVKKQPNNSPLLAARFLARQVAAETAKIVPSANAPKVENDFTGADDKEYGIGDHFERLRYIDVEASEELVKLLTDVLQSALPGLEHFLVDERLQILLGKMSYNAFGVVLDGGRNDKRNLSSSERTRTPQGTSHQIGAAFYTVSSYLTHSCTPNTRPTFANGTTELRLVADRDLKEGDELTVAYVDVTQRQEGETAAECRQRRRRELYEGWKFACTCERCEEEKPEDSEDGVPVDADGSKVEDSVRRFEDPSSVDP